MGRHASMYGYASSEYMELVVVRDGGGFFLHGESWGGVKRVTGEEGAREQVINTPGSRGPLADWKLDWSPGLTPGAPDL